METEMLMWLETGVGMKMNVVEMGLAFPTDIPIPNTLFTIFLVFMHVRQTRWRRRLSASEVAILWRYTNTFIVTIIIIIFYTPGSKDHRG